MSQQLDTTGSLLLPDFVFASTVEALKKEAIEHSHLAYYCSQSHTVYLSVPDPAFPSSHGRNRQVTGSKGCITDDQIPEDSYLREIYSHQDFRYFLCGVLGEKTLYDYDDPLSSINVHYYNEGIGLAF